MLRWTVIAISLRIIENCIDASSHKAPKPYIITCTYIHILFKYQQEKYITAQYYLYTCITLQQLD